MNHLIFKFTGAILASLCAFTAQATEPIFDNILIPRIVMNYVLHCQSHDIPVSDPMHRYCQELQTEQVLTTEEDRALIAQELLAQFDIVRTHLERLYRTWLAAGEIPEHYRALTRAVNCDTASVSTLIGMISSYLITCCTGYNTSFSGTWTALAALETDITTCCSTQQAHFVSTWTIINSLSNTSSCGPVTAITQALVTPGYAITIPGNYCLAEDVLYTGFGSAITTSTSNVFIDMQNHEIQVTIGLCIELEDGVNDVTITNGTLTGGVLGIGRTSATVSGNNNITIENCLFQGQANESIAFLMADNNTIAHCIFRNTNQAVFYENADNITIHDCIICNSNGAVNINTAGSNNSIQNCIMDLIITGPSVNITTIDNVSIKNCLIRNGSTSVEGISLTDCTSVNVNNCLASSCADGIIISSGIPTNATVTECYAFNNSNGIQVAASEVVIKDSIASSNVAFGIEIAVAGTNCIIQNCVTTNNASVGILGNHPIEATVASCISLNDMISISWSGSQSVIEKNIIIQGPVSTSTPASSNLWRNNEACISQGFSSPGGNTFYNNNAFNSTTGSGYGTITNVFNVNTPDGLTGEVSDILSNITNT